MGRYLASPGNARYSAEQISRVAYNAEPGSLGDYSASVHLVGELLGNVMDLVIRDATMNRRSMDDVMRLMLERYAGEHGYSGRDVERVTAAVCGCTAMHAIFDAHVRGATPIDFDRWLALAGLRAVVTRAPALDRDGKPQVDLRDDLARGAHAVGECAHGRHAAVRDREAGRALPDERGDARRRAAGGADRGDPECDRASMP